MKKTISVEKIGNFDLKLITFENGDRYIKEESIGDFIRYLMGAGLSQISAIRISKLAAEPKTNG